MVLPVSVFTKICMMASSTSTIEANSPSLRKPTILHLPEWRLSKCLSHTWDIQLPYLQPGLSKRINLVLVLFIRPSKRALGVSSNKSGGDVIANSGGEVITSDIYNNLLLSSEFEISNFIPFHLGGEGQGLKGAPKLYPTRCELHVVAVTHKFDCSWFLVLKPKIIIQILLVNEWKLYQYTGN